MRKTMMMTLWRHAVVRVDGHVCLHRRNLQLHVLGHSPWPLAPQVEVLLELVLGLQIIWSLRPQKGLQWSHPRLVSHLWLLSFNTHRR